MGLYVLVKDNRAELEASGYRVIRGAELTVFKTVTGAGRQANAVAVFPPRAVLNVGMLLRAGEALAERQTRPTAWAVGDLTGERHRTAEAAGKLVTHPGSRLAGGGGN
jgi:hypothetical protein